jgi:uncharacterized membrane protein YjfL (UPF0719 family)
VSVERFYGISFFYSISMDKVLVSRHTLKWATQMEILRAYAITFGWALVGSVSMGIGIIIALKMFDFSTRDVDEWALIKQGNIAMAIIIAAVIIALGIVVSSAMHP